MQCRAKFVISVELAYRLDILPQTERHGVRQEMIAMPKRFPRRLPPYTTTSHSAEPFAALSPALC
jgi:hypothetical protein